MYSEGKLAGAGQLMQQGGAQNAQYQNAAMGKQAAAPAPDTLLRAMSSADALNQRLMDVVKQITEIAIAIGGPWPASAAASSVAPTQGNPPAMAVLNERIDAAHARVGEIQDSIGAIQRALGA